MAASPRQALASAYRGFAAAGLGSGSSGNVSLRSGDGMLITPSGVGPDELRWEQVCAISLDGRPGPGSMPGRLSTATPVMPPFWPVPTGPCRQCIT